MKQCTKCKQTLPETEFCYRKDSNKLRNDCKKCRSDYYKNWREKNSEQQKQHHKDYYIKHKKIHQKRCRKYYLKNKERLKENSREYRKEHLEEKRECNRKWSKENKEKNRKYGKQHYQKNKKKILERNKKYRQKHKDEKNRLTRKRRLKKKQLYEDYTIEEWKQKVAEVNNICPLCGKPFSEVYPFCATIDHTPPVSKAPVGFHYTINDIRVMCGSCNFSKSNKWGDKN